MCRIPERNRKTKLCHLNELLVIIPGKKEADRLARQGSSERKLGPEPFATNAVI